MSIADYIYALLRYCVMTYKQKQSTNTHNVCGTGGRFLHDLIIPAVRLLCIYAICSQLIVRPVVDHCTRIIFVIFLSFQATMAHWWCPIGFANKNCLLHSVGLEWRCRRICLSIYIFVLGVLHSSTSTLFGMEILVSHKNMEYGENDRIHGTLLILDTPKRQTLIRKSRW